MSSGASGKRILVDAVYADEVRVAVLDEGKVVEFDQELKDRKQVRGGNVYYAVVRRIEPSLQAVFIEYGVGKHGFLPFSEISVEHFQLPPGEKEELTQSVYGDDTDLEEIVDEDVVVPDEAAVAGVGCSVDEKAQLATEDDRDGKRGSTAARNGKSKPVLHKMYKVQNVIKVDQKLMVQIIKEERGSKCATFSTYIVLAGRYCIFMPNSGSRNSGVSRRIEDCDNRKNLKKFISAMKLPKEAGVIIRTAGDNKSQREIEQDLKYLQHTWKEICDACASVESPTLLYVEADIIKRTLRDFCNESVHDVVVAGSQAYSVVKEYAKSMFGNKLRVRMYKGSVPVFTHYRVSAQILELYSDKIYLPSGGYLVITPTEALVSIDVNSGRMTGEDSIEETAYRTNMEAVKEIARQVNLRGLSGLIVIDFIDMIKYRYCRAVEAEIREAFKGDRAKVQFGYISAFGLMEISRQRVKQSILETSTMQCSHCKGVGRVRTLESISASILRDIRYLASKNAERVIAVSLNPRVLAYIFNNKRKHISDIEVELKVLIRLDFDESAALADFNIRTESGYTNAVTEEFVVPACGPGSPVTTIEEKVGEGADSTEEQPQLNVEQNITDSSWVRKWLTRALEAVS
ncbi:ribonuclease E [Anaplasma platys]|uniref:Ribonuclease G n=1 Tax=Anaplasma platys TaxID=949 RepID=A0A858PXS1_9RICK|nr:Rne/Rng family ribonuclease [Anaplasma platys]QJC27403.1 ribonuclease E [Anaplasma platys]